MDTLASTLQEIEDGIDSMSCNRSKLPGFQKLGEFFSHYCQMRHYSFCVMKCGSIDCHICKPPRLPGLHFIHDPVTDGSVYIQHNHYRERSTVTKLISWKARPWNAIQSFRPVCEEFLVEDCNAQNVASRKCFIHLGNSLGWIDVTWSKKLVIWCTRVVWLYKMYFLVIFQQKPSKLTS